MNTWTGNLKERSGREVLEQQNRLVCAGDIVSALNLMPHVVMILNEHRQIVWGNQCLLEVLKKQALDQVIGLRPGEAFCCVNADEAEYGCGTAKECHKCGVLVAILRSLEESGIEKECSILTTSHDALTLRVKAGTIKVHNEIFRVISMVDISDEKNRRIMERVFFHDTMNIAGAIQGLTDVLPEVIEENNKQEIDQVQAALSNSAANLIDQIKWQKDLLSAEKDELNIYTSPINAQCLIEEIKLLFEKSGAFPNKNVHITCSQPVRFLSDERILKRVLVNTVKNAMEAIEEGRSVEIGVKPETDAVRFEVYNKAFIPEDVQRRIFRKFFSTKSQDRGIGTYSIKLFTEKYLKGNVWFKSDPSNGTTFYIQVPFCD